MRIVAGKARGRKLQAPAGKTVRPTTDRVREALFSSLGTIVMDAKVLDLFAGSGALGLESLSRGATNAVFVERSRQVRESLAKNIAAAKFDSTSRIIPRDALAALKMLEQEKARFDLVFLDPPYEGSLLTESLQFIADSTLLNPNAIIVAEYPKDKVPVFSRLLRIRSTKSYGGTSISFIEQGDE